MADENILAVPTMQIPHDFGFKPITSESYKIFLRTIDTHGKFYPISDLENDPSLKQIIPYIMVIRPGWIIPMILTYERLRGGIEERFDQRVAFGFGNHVAESIKSSNPSANTGSLLEICAKAELGREIGDLGECQLKPFGVISENITGANSTHFVIIYTAKYNGNSIIAKSDDISNLASAGVPAMRFDKKFSPERLDPWALLIYNYVKDVARPFNLE